MDRREAIKTLLRPCRRASMVGAERSERPEGGALSGIRLEGSTLIAVTLELVPPRPDPEPPGA